MVCLGRREAQTNPTRDHTSSSFLRLLLQHHNDNQHHQRCRLHNESFGPVEVDHAQSSPTRYRFKSPSGQVRKENEERGQNERNTDQCRIDASYTLRRSTAIYAERMVTFFNSPESTVDAVEPLQQDFEMHAVAHADVKASSSGARSSYAAALQSVHEAQDLRNDLLEKYIAKKQMEENN